MTKYSKTRRKILLSQAKFNHQEIMPKENLRPGAWVLYGRLVHYSFLPTDPQTSMAATAAVSPSDYLQPAASTTQASGQWALRVGVHIAWYDSLKLPLNHN